MKVIRLKPGNKVMLFAVKLLLPPVLAVTAVVLERVASGSHFVLVPPALTEFNCSTLTRIVSLDTKAYAPVIVIVP
ncbi:hypothetical protein D3C74_405220 [compost metagenome]